MGGMATVIHNLQNDRDLNQEFDIDIYESYIDGNRLQRSLYSIYAFVRFLFTRRGYDIYHIHMASRGSAFRKGLYVRCAKHWHKKVIIHIHSGIYTEFYNGLPTWGKNYIKQTLASADDVIALSDGWRDKIRDAIGITNCIAINNGIDTDHYAAARTDVTVNQHTFAMLGHLCRTKGTYDLVEAVKIAVQIVPDIKVYLAGDGDEQQIAELVQQGNLENSITLLGWIDDAQKIDLLQKVSTIVLPSYGEGLPMSMLEGMAAGKAIISTTVGAIPEVIQEENGILIAPGDVSALADAMVRCCTDAAMMERMSANNIRCVEQRYSTRNMHAELAALYRTLAD